MRGGGMEVVVLAIHGGGDQIGAIEFELVVIGANAGVEQAFGEGIGVNAAVDRTVQVFVFGWAKGTAGVGAGGANGDQLGMRQVLVPGLQHMGVNEVVDEELLGRMLGGEIARGLIAGEVNDGRGIRVGGKNRLGLGSHRQVVLPARERKEGDASVPELLLQVLADKALASGNQYFSLGGHRLTTAD